MRILIVEDDAMQVEAISKRLVEAIPGVRVGSIATESEFRRGLDAIVADPPTAVVMDSILRWADPSPEFDPEAIPPEVRAAGPIFAGLRCASLLIERAPAVPIAYFTSLEPDAIRGTFPRAERTSFFKKGDLNGLLRHLRTLCYGP